MLRGSFPREEAKAPASELVSQHGAPSAHSCLGPPCPWLWEFLEGSVGREKSSPMAQSPELHSWQPLASMPSRPYSQVGSG